MRESEPFGSDKNMYDLFLLAHNLGVNAATWAHERNQNEKLVEECIKAIFSEDVISRRNKELRLTSSLSL